MSINFRVLLLCGLMVAFGAACSGGSQAEVLPTTTPRPTDIIPTNTPTPLPPPTVTPFPTGSGPGSVIEGEGSETGADSGTVEATEGGDSTSAPAAEDTQAATATTAPPPSSASSGNFPEGVRVEQRLYSADFAQGWPSVNDATASISIVEGQYVFNVGPFDARYINTGTVDAVNTYTQIDVTPGDCPLESGYGLIFRFVDVNNYFAATIFCNNTYSIIAKVSGSIVGDPFPDGALPGLRNSNSGTHKIGILSIGSTHTLYYDGQVVTSFDGGVHEQGDVAMYVISRGEDIIRAAYDNLEVWTAR